MCDGSSERSSVRWRDVHLANQQQFTRRSRGARSALGPTQPGPRAARVILGARLSHTDVTPIRVPASTIAHRWLRSGLLVPMNAGRRPHRLLGDASRAGLLRHGIELLKTFADQPYAPRERAPFKSWRSGTATYHRHRTAKAPARSCEGSAARRPSPARVRTLP